MLASAPVPLRLTVEDALNKSPDSARRSHYLHDRLHAGWGQRLVGPLEKLAPVGGDGRARVEVLAATQPPRPSGLPTHRLGGDEWQPLLPRAAGVTAIPASSRRPSPFLPGQRSMERIPPHQKRNRRQPHETNHHYKQQMHVIHPLGRLTL